MPPFVAVAPLSLDRPSPHDKRADRERLLDGLAHAGIDMPVEIPAALVRELPAVMRESDFAPAVVLCSMKEKVRVAGLNAGAVCAVAVDIGTTNIVASLFDARTSLKIGTMDIENPQIAFGPDVLSRVHAAMGGRGPELHRLVVGGVNGLIRNLCGKYGVNSPDIYAAVIAGNTIMTHFLFDLPVDNIPVEPYIPAAHKIGFAPPGDMGLDINGNGMVYVFPNAGSYVGGDIIAGILSTGLYRHKSPSLLVDVGTNAEIVLGCDEWIMVGAGAAGPALEGGISKIGMRATEGAVCGVEIESAGKGGYEVRLKTIGDGEPVGICGSGIIELVAELYKTGVINRQGKFSGMSEGLAETGFTLYESGGTQLAVTALDIDNFLRSKAAMFTSLHVLVKSVGLGFGDIGRVYVSGAFGTGINADKAAAIGMIPDIGRDKLIAPGNSSLSGAEMVIGDTNLLHDVDRICGMITYREMNTDGEFMREFPGALFIPHTDPEVLKG